MSNCYHCDLPIPNQTDYYVIIDTQKQSMCCPGCAAVAQFIVDNGLDGYYSFRTQAAVTQQTTIQISALPTIADDLQTQQRLLISGIVCSACVWLIETRLQQLPGLIECHVDLHSQQALVSWDKDQLNLNQIIGHIQKLGYQAAPYVAAEQESIQKKEYQQSLKRLAVSGLGMMQVMTHAFALYLGSGQSMRTEYVLFFQWMSLLLTTPILLYAGKPFICNAIRAVLRKRVNMDVPVSLAVLCAYCMSFYTVICGHGTVYFDSVCMFIFFLTLSRFLAMLAKHKAASTLLRLQQATPTTATLYTDEVSKCVPISELKIGDRILVRPGEQIPCDGIITWGQASVSEAILNGESAAKEKKLSDAVIAGSHNIDHAFVMRITQTDNSTLNILIRLLTRAQNLRPNLASIADQIARYFIITVLLLAFATGFFWWSVSPEQAIIIALTVLVATCPCALSLAAPTAITIAANEMMANGFLLIQPKVLENLNQVTDVVFDKTGTLTDTNLTIANISLLADVSEKYALSIARSLEIYSEHPIAKAFLQHSVNDIHLEQVENYCGQGLQGYIDGQCYRLGKAEFVAAIMPNDTPVVPHSEDSLWVLLGNEAGPMAWFGLRNQLRDDASDVLAELQQQGLSCHLLSGDTTTAVNQLGNELKLNQMVANASPEEKLNYVNKLQNQGKRVLMVGDGLNDAPVLAAATISVAMGQGSDLAKANADVVILNSHLSSIVQAITLASKMKKIVQQNFLWAIAYNLTVLPLAASGSLSPEVAAFGMSVSSLIVLANAMRLRLGWQLFSRQHHGVSIEHEHSLHPRSH